MAGPGKDQSEAYNVAAVSRAIDVLEVFSHRHPELLLTEIAARVDLPTATVFRMLSTLERRNLVTRDGDTGKYRLGYKMIEFGDIAKARNDLLDKARPVMAQIRDETNETTYISVRSGHYRIDLEQVEGTMDVRRVVAVGRSRPLFVGCPGKVFLSAFDEAARRKYLDSVRLVDDRFGPVDRARLDRELIQIRKNGYAETRNRTGAGAISAPVLGASGEVLAALTVSTPYVRYTDELRTRILSAVLRGAAAISVSMGAQGRITPSRRRTRSVRPVNTI